VKVAKNTWHTLKVEATGNHFVVTYDGNKVLDAKDETFKQAGKVGLWTKADSVIEFDDLTVELNPSARRVTGELRERTGSAPSGTKGPTASEVS
jgi:hypothetical protein